jgi:hypothetical protein
VTLQDMLLSVHILRQMPGMLLSSAIIPFHEIMALQCDIIL